MQKYKTIAHLFELAISSEVMMAKCHTSLAQMFSHRPDVANSWKEMAGDEVAHKNKLEAIRDSLDPETLAGEADAALMGHIEEALEFPLTERILAVLNLNDALELTHELEYSELNSGFRFLASKFIDPTKRIDFALPELDEHLERLMKFSERYGNAEQKRDIKTERHKNGKANEK